MNVVSEDLRNRERKMYKQFKKFVVQNQKFLSSLKKRRKNKLPDCEDIKLPYVPIVGAHDSKHVAIITNNYHPLPAGEVHTTRP